MWSLPLIDPGTNQIHDDVWDQITMQQHKRFSLWSIETGKSVIDLLRSARFVCRENGGNFGVVLEGTLPHCSLHGGLHPDGSCHT